MPIVEHDRLNETRSLLRNWSSQFLMRSYDATPEDYLEIADEDLKAEFLDGELIVHSPATLRHEDVAGFLFLVLRDHVSRNKLGHVWGSNAVVQLGPNRYFSPDVSYLSLGHDARIQNERVVGPVDLAVEVLSKSTRRYDRGDKLAAYMDGRVPEIWLVDPDEGRWDVHALRGDSYERASLSTGPWTSAAIPTLTVDASWFWRKPLPSLDECRINS